MGTELQADRLIRQLPDQFSRATTAPRPSPRKVSTPRPTRLPAATLVGNKIPPALPRPTPQPAPPLAPRPTPQSVPQPVFKLPPSPNPFQKFIAPALDFGLYALNRESRGLGNLRDAFPELLDFEPFPGSRFNLRFGFSKVPFSEFQDEFEGDPYSHPHAGFSHRDLFADDPFFAGDPGFGGFLPRDILRPVSPVPLLPVPVPLFNPATGITEFERDFLGLPPPLRRFSYAGRTRGLY